jgi:hypothetical protein
MVKTKTLLAMSLLLSTIGLTTGRPLQAETVYQGSVCSLNVHKLTSDITWYTDLKQAEKLAAGENKLVFWVHMLGKVDGAT